MAMFYTQIYKIFMLSKASSDEFDKEESFKGYFLSILALLGAVTNFLKQHQTEHPSNSTQLFTKPSY